MSQPAFPARPKVALVAACFLIGLSISVRADDSSDARSLELFEKHVRPTLVDACIRCHGPEKQKGGLRLDSAEWLRAGGDSGEIIDVDDPDESILLSAIRYRDPALEMPPKGKLPDESIAALENWVRSGAIDPRTDSVGEIANPPGSPTVDEGRSFWAFQPIMKPSLPDVVDEDWLQTDIDRFVLAKLESNQIKPTADADRMTLLRRVSYDLVGLPPTPQQISAFIADESTDAYENLIDRLLNSPRFGQRWGRHWLDVVRFAQSSGGGRTLLFPDAWRYRDYVIDVFNDDVPYDQFLTEQIAGDLLHTDDWQQQRRQLTATAFLLLGPTNYEKQDKDELEMDVVDEQLDTIGKSMLGMTIGCARCHDHKFDPIPAEDYYALAGILKSTKAMIHDNVSTWNKVVLPVGPELEAVFERRDEQIAEIRKRIDETKAELEKIGGKPRSAKKKRKLEKRILSSSIHGIVVDDTSAELIGQWTPSTFSRRYVDDGYIHDGTAQKGSKQVIYRPQIETPGAYDVQIGYSASKNRSRKVPVQIYHADGESLVRIDQVKTPEIQQAFTSVGVFQFDGRGEARIVISNEGTEDGVVIADAVVLVPSELPPLRSPQQTEKPDNIPSIARDADRVDEVQFLRVDEGAQLIARQRDTLQQKIGELEDKLSRVQKKGPQREYGMVTGDDEDAGDIPLAIRGVVHNPGPITPRGLLQVASNNPRPPIPEGQSGRRELAAWIASADNPLTARVMVNRVWHWLFGRGIVASVDNFGQMGDRPTHPELLDHLAATFMDDGWSVKQLIRRIMLSRAYRLGTDDRVAGSRNDPQNRLLWRMNRKRLDAEQIRDTLLQISGSLDEAMGGPNLKPGTSSEYGYAFQSMRRSVYVPVFRNTLPEIFEVFDFADPNIQRGKRTTSTISSQALLLMNHPLVIAQTRMAAEREIEAGSHSVGSHIETAYLKMLGRHPSAEEEMIAIEFLGDLAEDEGSRNRLGMLYQALMQCVDFRYLN